MSSRRVALLTGLVAVAIGFFMFAVGLPIFLIVMFAALVVLVGGMVSTIDDPDEPKLPAVLRRFRGGARREVSDAAWRLTGTRGRIAPIGAQRLRAVATHRLALRGIDLDDPSDSERARAALGPLAYQVVSRPAQQSISTLRATVSAIERLGPPDRLPAEAQPTPAGRVPRRIA